MNDYPLPSHAVGVWFDGDGFTIRFPPEPGKDRGHMVHVATLAQVEPILRERAIAKHRGIGTASAPTQYQLETIKRQFEALNEIKKSRKAPPVRSQPITSLNLEDLGLL